MTVYSNCTILLTPSNSGTIEESNSSTNPNEAFNFIKLTVKEESPSSNNTSEVEIPD